MCRNSIENIIENLRSIQFNINILQDSVKYLARSSIYFDKIKRCVSICITFQKVKINNNINVYLLLLSNALNSRNQ